MANYSDIRYVFNGVAEYATADNLPTSGNTTGDQALVTGTNRLYIWNGTGWYNIALINTTPSISGASSSYTLAADGTATTVTITATDPEGLPITYSIASDTSGNIATVTQGTGANTNVFTITPSTSTANAGTFSLTFRASDGVNIATAVSSFTLEFIVANSKYTTALITSVGANNAVNNSFDDASTNNHTVTANGNVTQNTFSPYRHGGYSTYFDGAGDYIDFSQTTAIGTNDFTLEAWVYPESFGTNEAIFCTLPSGGSSMQLNIDASGDLTLWYKGVTSGDSVTISSVFTQNTWQHIAVVGDSTANEIKIYKDGTQIGSTINYNYDYSASSTYRVGRNRGGTAYFNGYLRDVRLVYSKVYTTNFTPTSEPLTAITDTKLLTCHLPYIVDGSSDGNTATLGGDTKTEPFVPYDNQKYATGTHGGSMYFDGTSGYVSGDMTADLAFGTDDMTLECWVYPNTISGLDAIFDTRTTNFLSDSFTIQLDTGVPQVFAGDYSNTNPVIAGTSAVPASIWTHIAFSRSSGTNTLFINGTSVATNTNSWNQSFSSANDWAVGETPPTSTPRYFDGYISDFRIVKGSAVYTSAFTPPTTPLTAITYTQLLLNGTNAGIIDKSQSVQTLTLNGDVKSSTTQSKYLTSSMYFDGTGDYVQTPISSLLTFGSGDFTVEGWFYTTSTGAYQYIFDGRNGGTDVTYLYLNNGTGLYAGYGNVNDSSVTTLSLNQWYHFAYVRNGSGTNNITVYIDGTAEWQITNTTDLSSTTRITLGSRYNGADYFGGYISDVRVTKGLARYTANFTPPTAALGG